MIKHEKSCVKAWIKGYIDEYMVIILRNNKVYYLNPSVCKDLHKKVLKNQNEKSDSCF